jgi:hypothetical protein
MLGTQPLTCWSSPSAQLIGTNCVNFIGATRTYCNVRYPVVMGWQADLEEAVLNNLDL